MTFKTEQLSAFAALALISTLVACGGGGGGTGGGGTITPPTNPPATATPCPAGYTGSAPNCVAPTNATASGKLVDHETGNPIAGMYVGLAPNTVGAAPVAQPTTAADGSFSFTATPGTYLLVIGDGLNNRPVIHNMVTLTAGANTLTAPNIGTPPGATAIATEHSGNFRLTTMNSTEQGCLAYENSKRAGLSLSAVTADEWLMEDSRWYQYWASHGSPPPGTWQVVVNYDAASGTPTSDCTGSLNSEFGISGQWPQNPSLIWFAGTASSNVSAEDGMFDPRGPLPAPTPPNPWP